MWVRLANVSAAVVRATDEEMQWLNDYLTFEDPRSQHSLAVQNGTWDGKMRLLNMRTRAFPAGLLPLVRKGASKAGFAVESHDERRRIEPLAADAVDLSWLDNRREQPEIVEACLRETRGVIWAPTGCGKTLAFVALGMRVPCNWAILTHKTDLLHQTAEVFRKRANERPGRIGDGVWEPRRWTVATLQTLHASRSSERTKQFLASVEGFVTDECHIAASDTFSAVMRAMPNAYYRLGFSGTPLARGDQRNILLVAATGPVIHRVRVQNLIERGVLSRPEITFVNFDNHIDGESWREVYTEGVVRNEARNRLIARIVDAAEKPCLVFVKEIEHGKKLSKLIGAAGHAVEFVHGWHEGFMRQGAIKRLQKAHTTVLISSSIFNEGVDIPEVASLVIAAGGKSAIAATQQLGRGMRTTATKDSVELWDIYDRGQFWLSRQSGERLKIHAAEGHQVTWASITDVELKAAIADAERGRR